MKTAVLLSGGVDSSVTLKILKDKDHDLTAFYIKIWLEDELAHLGDCPWQEDLRYAQAVCEKYDVPLEIISLQKDYLDKIVSYTLEELRAGRTPSPDIFCNARIKFGTFYEKIHSQFTKVATGHYAQIEEHNGLYLLKRSPDAIKDQTYFLAHLNQKQLARACFPVGDYFKTVIRTMAKKDDIPTNMRKDSQGICFLGTIKFDEFIRFHLGEKPGDILDIQNSQRLGEHKGYWFHTIGQRHGLGLSGGPWFVVKKDIDTNTIYVTHKDHLEKQARSSFIVHQLHWISGNAPKTNVPLQLKLRHGEKLFDAAFELQGDSAHVAMAESDSGIAQGQFAVFYHGPICLGCGRIA